MKTLTQTWLIAAMLAAASVGASAQDSKIGYVNTTRITAESGPAKAAQIKLEQEFSKRQKELADQQASLKALSEKFERDAPTLSETQRATRQKEFQELGRDFQRKQRELREDINIRKNEELSSLQDRINKAVQTVAESESYDLVVYGGVAFASKKIDITDKVLKLLGKK